MANRILVQVTQGSEVVDIIVDDKSAIETAYITDNAGYVEEIEVIENSNEIDNVATMIAKAMDQLEETVCDECDEL